MVLAVTRLERFDAVTELDCLFDLFVWTPRHQRRTHVFDDGSSLAAFDVNDLHGLNISCLGGVLHCSQNIDPRADDANVIVKRWATASSTLA